MKGFPTLLFFPAGDAKAAVPYEGERCARALLFCAALFFLGLSCLRRTFARARAAAARAATLSKPPRCAPKTLSPNPPQNPQKTNSTLEALTAFIQANAKTAFELPAKKAAAAAASTEGGAAPAEGEEGGEEQPHDEL